MSDPTRVAIACQGGGSHTAYTAGVLEELFRECDWDDEFELVGISGASGGAFNALAAWYGFVSEGPDRAAELVDAIWNDLAATEFGDRLLNGWLKQLNALHAAGVPLPEVSPYDVPGEEIGKTRIREVLETHVDFDEIEAFCTREAPELVVGTVDVNAGVFETFVDEAVTVEAVLASAAVPNAFQAVEIHGHYHWDALFSQNPPIDDLMGQPPARKPEELWIVQVNPQTFEGEPKTVEEIADRRNELSGNISMNQELRFVEQVNEWIEDGRLPPEEFSKTAIHRIAMGKRFGASSKIDRDPDFLDELQALGRERCGEFLDGR
ncbi:patatin-like phospholipase family protein [Halococcoides cellulosivorans]|uniref:Patatin n=1 Tax=Halococcoides cellulosivorans TaxID=1679096 RepID=A0A2R4X1H1_9EURY|nr:patatin-like phospholipase family protein [Halococcoides cellulosivorans]AWB27644.1 patatin [Halococcoides cellulosivorans]